MTTASGTKVVRVAFSEVEFNVGTPSVGVSVVNGSGSLLILAQGIVAEFSGTPTITIPFLSLSATLVSIEINTLSAPVNETFPGRPTPLVLGAGRYIRIAANGLEARLGPAPASPSDPDTRAVITADFAFEQATATGTTVTGSVTKIGIANLSFNGTQAIENARGALVATSAGIAGVVYGTLSGGVGSATLGLKINTTGADVHTSVAVGGTVIAIDVETLPAPYVSFIAELDLNFGDLVEIRGTFELNPSGEFSGTGIDIFVGRGPSLIDGDPNPNAIGLLLSNATLKVKKFTTSTWALYASGTLALVGLDGLVIEGTVELRINTHTAAHDFDGAGGLDPVQANSWRVTGTGIKVKVGDVLEVGGNLVVNRQPTGALDLSFSGASVKVAKIDGVWAFELGGAASFTISPTNGFRLQSFKVDGFKIFGVGLGSTGSAPTLFPTARLSLFEDALDDALQAGAQVLTTEALSGRLASDGGVMKPYLDVVFEDRGETPVGFDAGAPRNSIIDADPEFELLIDGVAPVGLTVGATPVLVAPNTYRYFLNGVIPPAGVVSVQFLANSFATAAGSNFNQVERFVVVPDATTKPGPLAQLSNPANGEGVTADTINAKRYIDITYSSIDGSAMQAVNGTPFTISGTGIGDLMLTAANAPVLIGSPLLVSGTAGTSKALTYRYFLKDKNTANTLEVFQVGAITVTFTQGGFSTAEATNRRLVQTFTVSAAAPGGAGSTAPLKVGANGPLELLGPSISLADVGFDEGMLVLSIAIGVDRAKLIFGTGDSVTAELVGVLGTFDLEVDAFGLLSGNVNIGLSQVQPPRRGRSRSTSRTSST